MSKSLPAVTAFVQTKAGELRSFIQSGGVQQTVRGWFGRGNGNRDLDIFQKLLNGSKEGSRKDLLINQLEDGTTVIFRKDFGSLSHGKPNHYNIEIQVPFRNGMKTIENLHIEVDDLGGIIQITR